MRLRYGGSAFGGALALGLLLAGLVAPVASAADGQVTISESRTTSFPRVSLRMAVFDTNGAPIGGLTPEAFSVQENGQAVESYDVQPVRQSKTPLSVVMAMDVSGSMKDEGKMDRAREAAAVFVSELRPIDQVEIIGFGSTVTNVVPFTNDRKALSAGIQKLTPTGDTALYDALYAAVSDAARRPGNRVVLALSDGKDTSSKAKQEQATDLARQSGVPIYTIGLGQEVEDAVLTSMADSTSGRYFKAPRADDLTYTFKLLSRQIQNEYELVYISPLTQQPGTRVSTTVTVRMDDRPLAAQFSYLMPQMAQKDPSGVPVEVGPLRPAPDLALPAAPVELPPYWIEAVALLAALGVLALFLGIAYVSSQSIRQVRLSTYVGGPEAPGQLRSRRQGINPTQMLSRLAYKSFRWVLPKTWIQDARTMLIMAGVSQGHGAEEFMGLRVLLAFAFASLGYLLFGSSGIARGVDAMVPVMVVALAAIGYLLPVAVLRQRIKARQTRILKAMPNALDLLSVSVEAGLGFDQALMEVCSKWQNPLTHEFTVTLNELRLGRSRKEALQGLMNRTRVPELGTFASAIIQSDELGSSITRTLQSQAEHIRLRRKHRAQELAHQAAVKMTFPLVLLLLPALFVVILGPAVPKIMDALGHL